MSFELASHVRIRLAATSNQLARPALIGAGHVSIAGSLQKLVVGQDQHSGRNLRGVRPRALLDAWPHGKSGRVLQTYFALLEQPLCFLVTGQLENQGEAERGQVKILALPGVISQAPGDLWPQDLRSYWHIVPR